MFFRSTPLFVKFSPISVATLIVACSSNIALATTVEELHSDLVHHLRQRRHQHQRHYYIPINSPKTRNTFAFAKLFGKKKDKISEIDRKKDHIDFVRIPLT